MSVREGVHAITRVVDGRQLELRNGWWDHGDAVAGEPSPDDTNLTHPDQRWLFAHPPGVASNVYVLLNLRGGAFAGVWEINQEAPQRLVTCSPMRSSSLDLQWRILADDSPQPEVVFHWLNDEAKVLASSKTGNRITVAVDNDDRLKRWHLRPLDTGEEKWQAWMDRLPDDLDLVDINLPSTHQSLANRGVDKVRPGQEWKLPGETSWLSWMYNLPFVSQLFFQPRSRPWVPLPMYIDNPRCQDASVWDQLRMGIRSFDLRLDLEQDQQNLERRADEKIYEGDAHYLYARHGLAEMGYSWSAVLLILRVFLQQCPSEFILMNVRYEKASGKAPDRSAEWLDTFVEETEPFWEGEHSIVYPWWRHGAPNMTDLQLRDVRGKVVLTTNGDYMPADNRDGRHSHRRFMPVDMRCVGKYNSHRDQWDTQLQDCENNLAAAKSWAPSLEHRPPYHQTSFNVSGLPKILKYKFVLRDPLRPWKGLRDARNQVFDPRDFFDYFRTLWLARGASCPLSEESLGRNGQYRVGKIDFDFAEAMPDWIANVIRSNRSKEGHEF